MHFSKFVDILALLAFLPSIALAGPVNSSFAHLNARATTCNDATFNLGPCICNDELGLRLKNLPCQQIGFHFRNAASTTDGTLNRINGAQSSVGNVQCDHVVELQVIASSIPDNGAACQHFLNNKNDFQTFFNTINGSPNLVFVEAAVNKAKLSVFTGVFSATSFQSTTSKAASGLVSYLQQLQSGQFFNIATTISTTLDNIVGGTNLMQNFQAKVNSQVTQGITLTNQQISNLSPTPNPGGALQFTTPFSPNNPPPGCTRKRSMWEGVKALVVRAVTGKKTAPPPASACELPNTTPSTSTTSTTNAKLAKNAKSAPGTGKTATAKGSVKSATAAKTATKAPTAKTSAAKVAPKKATTATKAPTVKAPATKVSPKKAATKVATKAPVVKAAPKKAAVKAVPKKAPVKVAPKKAAVKVVPKKATLARPAPKKAPKRIR